jgi:hypothetical protein
MELEIKVLQTTWLIDTSAVLMRGFMLTLIFFIVLVSVGMLNII